MCLNLRAIHSLRFLIDGPTPASFSFIFVFSYKFSSQQDSNSDRQSKRRGRWPLDHHHGPIVVDLVDCIDTANLPSNRKLPSKRYRSQKLLSTRDRTGGVVSNLALPVTWEAGLWSQQCVADMRGQLQPVFVQCMNENEIIITSRDELKSQLSRSDRNFRSGVDFINNFQVCNKRWLTINWVVLAKLRSWVP